MAAMTARLRFDNDDGSRICSGAGFLLICHQPCCRSEIESRIIFPAGWHIEASAPVAKSTDQHDVSILSEAKNGLACFKANDWSLIVDKATRVGFTAGDQIVRRGRRSNGIYVLLKGKALVKLPAAGAPMAVGPGEICGEISFIDGLPATADVVATEAVEAYFLDAATLQTLFELFPHMGSRFYQSLASILSRRLRDVIGRRTPSAT
jgi:CRP-like cAMP-binding protein